MSKKSQSFSIDEDIKEELKHREELNASQVVNNYLREFLDATDATEEEVIVREINNQIQDIDDDVERLARKRRRLVNRRERVKGRTKRRENEKFEEVLERLSMIPADPQHPQIVSETDELDMTPEELAQEVADYHGKEYQTQDDDFRSI
jgi:transposase